VSLWTGGKVQHLVDSVFECDQLSRYEFITDSGEFVPVAYFKEFPQTVVGKNSCHPDWEQRSVPGREAFPGGSTPDRNLAEKTDDQSN
jgi:hypothetical protein